MKTFKEFLLTEDPRNGYHEWGIIHPSGKMVSGDNHPTATDHHQLLRSTIQKGENPRHYAQYAMDKSPEAMYLRTHHNKVSLGNAIKAYDKLPHASTKEVKHDHKRRLSDVYTVGHKEKVYNHLKQLHSEAPEE